MVESGDDLLARAASQAEGLRCEARQLAALLPQLAERFELTPDPDSEDWLARDARGVLHWRLSAPPGCPEIRREGGARDWQRLLEDLERGPGRQLVVLLQAGAAAYIKKPFRNEEILKLIERLPPVASD